MNLNKLAVKFSMDTSSDVPFVLVEDFKIYLSSINVRYGQKQPALVIVTNKTLTKDVIKLVRKELKFQGMIVKSVGLAENALFIFINTVINTDKLIEKIKNVVKVLKTLNISELDYCPFCGSSEDLGDFRMIEGIKVRVHNHCVTEFLESAETKLSEHEAKSYVKGLLYGLFGALIGAIPAFIILFWFGFYSAWLFVIIPLVSFWMYKKSGSPKTMISVIYVTVLSLILALLIGLLYYQALLYAYQMTFSDMFANPELTGYFYTDMAMILVFSLIGILVSWNFMYKNTSNSLRKNLSQYKK